MGEETNRKKRKALARDTFGLIDGLEEMGPSPGAVAAHTETPLSVRKCVWIALNKWPMTHNKNYYE